MYSDCCCSCSFEAEIIKIGQSSRKMYSNNIVKFQESATIVNACTKKSGNLLKAPHNVVVLRHINTRWVINGEISFLFCFVLLYIFFFVFVFCCFFFFCFLVWVKQFYTFKSLSLFNEKIISLYTI